MSHDKVGHYALEYFFVDDDWFMFPTTCSLACAMCHLQIPLGSLCWWSSLWGLWWVHCCGCNHFFSLSLFQCYVFHQHYSAHCACWFLSRHSSRWFRCLQSFICIFKMIVVVANIVCFVCFTWFVIIGVVNVDVFTMVFHVLCIHSFDNGSSNLTVDLIFRIIRKIPDNYA